MREAGRARRTGSWPVCGFAVPVVAAAAVGTLTSCANGGADAQRASHVVRPSASPATSAPAAADAASRFRSPRSVAAVPVPVRLRIPSIGVNTRLDQVGLDRTGAIAAPKGPQKAAWYKGGPRPGQPGPAVLLGHVDSDHAPAVFYRLAFLKPGAQVLVDRADGSTVRFRVSGRIQVAKSRFPADLVYGPTLAPSLRLVTCGGKFNYKTHHYRDNIIVSAVPQEGSP
jgi:hypothetical protein